MTIVFEYQDRYTNGKWREQTAVCSSVEDMIAFYGLRDSGVKWRIKCIKNI